MRKKNLILTFGLMAFAAAAVSFNSLSKESEPLLLIENLEALAKNEASSKKYDCYSILEGNGQSISCSSCEMHDGTPPWYHFGSKCTKD